MFLSSCCTHQREIMCILLNVSPSGVEEALRQCVNGNKNVLQAVQELVVMQHSIIYTLLCMARTISMCNFTCRVIISIPYMQIGPFIWYNCSPEWDCAGNIANYLKTKIPYSKWPAWADVMQMNWLNELLLNFFFRWSPSICLHVYTPTCHHS